METDQQHHNRLRAVFEEWARTWPRSPSVVLPPVHACATSANYAFAGVTREIVIWISHDVSIAVMHGDVFWDLLVDFAVLPEQQDDGQWKCGYSDCLDPSCYASPEALLQGHVIDPLANWITNTLHPAQWLELCETPGATWARLKTEQCQTAARLCTCIRVHETE